MKTTDSGSLDLTRGFIRKLVCSVRELGMVHLVSQWTRLGCFASQRAVAMTLSSSSGSRWNPSWKRRPGSGS